jgi:hypothetical protein
MNVGLLRLVTNHFQHEIPPKSAFPTPDPGDKKFNSRPVAPTFFQKQALRRVRRRVFLLSGKGDRKMDQAQGRATRRGPDSFLETTRWRQGIPLPNQPLNLPSWNNSIHVVAAPKMTTLASGRVSQAQALDVAPARSARQDIETETRQASGKLMTLAANA